MFVIKVLKWSLKREKSLGSRQWGGGTESHCLLLRNEKYMNGNVLIVWCNGDIKMALRHNLNSNYALRNFEQFLATFDALLTFEGHRWKKLTMTLPTLTFLPLFSIFLKGSWCFSWEFWWGRRGEALKARGKVEESPGVTESLWMAITFTLLWVF